MRFEIVERVYLWISELFREVSKDFHINYNEAEILEVRQAIPIDATYSPVGFIYTFYNIGGNSILGRNFTQEESTLAIVRTLKINDTSIVVYIVTSIIWQIA